MEEKDDLFRQVKIMILKDFLKKKKKAGSDMVLYLCYVGGIKKKNQ